MRIVTIDLLKQEICMKELFHKWIAFRYSSLVCVVGTVSIQSGRLNEMDQVLELGRLKSQPKVQFDEKILQKP